MAATQRAVRNSRTVNNRNQYYVDGNVVRRSGAARELEGQPQKKISNTARKNRERAKHMNAGYVLFLCMALVVTGIILINYIGLQSDITNSVKHIS